tara:strand:- start:227 stop:1684 length:1458 start_codon:yes stop_codon:yes gene_type:complete
MQRFKTFKSLSEATIMKPDYIPGAKVIWKGTSTPEFDKAGYKKGDVFEVVSGAAKIAAELGSKTGEYEKFLKAPDGKVYHLRGGNGYKSSDFTQHKEGGGMPSGAEWEDLIVFAYNQLNNQKTDPTTEEAAMKYWDGYKEQATVIAKNFNSNLAAKALVHTGRGGAVGTVTLGPLWNFSRADKTPKTDIASNDFKERISLKKAGGSQLASSGKAEGIAIVKAALSEMGNETKFAQDLISDMETKMERLVSNSTVTKLKQDAAKGLTSPGIVDFQAKDKQNKELSTLLSSYMNQNSAANALFSKHIVLEAATGNHKFGSSKAKAAANMLGKFEIGGKVVLEPINSINDPIIQKYAQTVKPAITFKAGGGGSPAYSSLRLNITAQGESVQSFRDIIVEELSKVDGLLTEDYLCEGPFDMLKRAGAAAIGVGKGLVAKVEKAIKDVMAKVKATLKKIAAAGKTMFSQLMNFLGLEISHAVNIPGEVSL